MTQHAKLVESWHRARAVVAGLFTLVSVGTGFAWGRSASFVIAAFAFIAFADAMTRCLLPHGRSPLISLALDITLINGGLAISNVPHAALGVPFAYILLAAMVLAPMRWAVVLIIYAASWFSVVILGVIPSGTDISRSRAAFGGVVTNVLFAGAVIALLWVTARIINRDAVRKNERLYLERAVAQVSQALLGRADSNPIRTALGIMRGAVGGTSAFYSKNHEDPARGLCTTLLEEVLAPGALPEHPDHWRMVPWRSMPGRSELAAGRPVAFRVADLPDLQRAIFDGTDIQSEVDVPVFVNDEWHGVLGFADIDVDTVLSDRHLAVLQRAAALLGDFLARDQARAELEATVERLDRNVRYQRALADCSSALLATNAPRALDPALAALLTATDADYAYIDVNYQDPDRGLCTRVVHDAEKPTKRHSEGEKEWWFGPYSELPTSYEALSQGRPAEIVTSRLDGAERTLYENDGIEAELCIPIEVNGDWYGSVGFADYSEERRWTHGELRALRTAADMIGAFLERKQARDHLEAMVESLDGRLHYEEALSACSRTLLLGSDSAAIDTALAHLAQATGAHNVFLDVNYEDDVQGLCAEVTNEVTRPGFESLVDEEIWIDDETGETRYATTPYAALPDVRTALEQGRPAVVFPRTLSSPEREVYGKDGCRSELNIPIMMDGRWAGCIGFSDYLEERHWATEDVSLLQTAAGMIGAYWARTRARSTLEELVRSKDQFVAAVSHELRTPLTAVVGLAHELRDRRDDFDAEDIGEFVNLLVEQSDEVSNIVDDLLVAARVSSGSLVVIPEDVDLLTEVDRVIRSSGAPLSERVAVTGDRAVAHVDETRLRQILRNLLVNAERYGGASVEVAISKKEHEATITVADDGPGIGDIGEDEIFEPYMRAAHDHAQPASVGLGLAVARDLARLMQGDIVHERRDGWTRFIVSLPLADTASHTPLPQEPAAAS